MIQVLPFQGMRTAPGFRLEPGSAPLDVIPMPLGEEAHNIPGTVNDGGEQVGDVTPQRAHVEGLQGGEGGKATTKQQLVPVFLGQPDLGVEQDRSDDPADASQLMRVGNVWQRQRFEHVRAEDRAVRSRVCEQRCLHPGTIAGKDLSANHRADNPIITEMPHAVDSQRCGPFCRDRCSR